MAHKGAEKSNMPRVAFEVSKELKKAWDHYLIENDLSVKVIMTKLLERIIAGEISLGNPPTVRRRPSAVSAGRS